MIWGVSNRNERFLKLRIWEWQQMVSYYYYYCSASRPASGHPNWVLFYTVSLVFVVFWVENFACYRQGSSAVRARQEMDGFGSVLMWEAEHSSSEVHFIFVPFDSLYGGIWWLLDKTEQWHLLAIPLIIMVVFSMLCLF